MNDKDSKTRAQGLFVIGVALMVIGMATGNIAFLGAGLTFIALGIRTRKLDTA